MKELLELVKELSFVRVGGSAEEKIGRAHV